MPVHDVAAAGFGAASDVYERARPTYPPDAVAWLVAALGLGPGVRAVDLAAGTGKLTRLLVDRDYDVVAVEPVEAMRGQLVAAQPGHPRLPAGEGLRHGDDLAGGAARVGVVQPAVVRRDVGLDDPQVQVVAATHRLDVPERLGEVVLGVEEDDLEVGRDLRREVDEHAVLERGGEHEPVPEAIGGPLDRRRRGLSLEGRRDRGELAQVGELVLVHVTHSPRPTSAS